MESLARPVRTGLRPFVLGIMSGLIIIVGCIPTPPGPAPADNGPNSAVVAGTNTVDLGFRPIPNGFNFANYGNEGNPANLTAAEMRLLFGDKVCASVQGDRVVLTPAAQRWMNEQNKGMNGGHCEGMAALSILFFGGQKSPADFGGATAYAVPNGASVQREIARWFVTQSTEPTASSELRASAQVIVERLRTAFAAGTAQESWTLGMYGGGGGHAVTPYRIDARGGGLYGIAIYDNNYPGQELFVEVDLNTNTWSYTSPTVPGEVPMAFRGNATSDTLSITPTSARLRPQQCPFLRSSEAATRQVWLDGKGDLLITDEQSRRIGYSNGTLVNDIPDAKAIFLRTGGGHEPIYQIPGQNRLTVILDGAALSNSDESDVCLIGPDYVLSVDDIQLAPGQQDTITFSGDSSQVTYQTCTAETPTLGIGITTEGADWEFYIRAAGESDGQRIDIRLDTANQQLVIRISAADGSTDYDIEVHRITDEGEEVFTHAGNSIKTSDSVHLMYGQWQGDGTPIPFGVDEEDDGDIDQTTLLEDDGLSGG